MKKISISILIFLQLINLNAANNKLNLPISAKYLSVDNGGELSAYNAYRDGVGLFVSTNLSNGNTGSSTVSYDNSDMNSLVYKYGKEANDLSLSLKEIVLNNDSNNKSVDNIGKFQPIDTLSVDNGVKENIIPNGTLCDDGDSLTVEDQYFNDVCSGINNLIQMEGTLTYAKALTLEKNKAYLFNISNGPAIDISTNNSIVIDSVKLKFTGSLLRRINYTTGNYFTPVMNIWSGSSGGGYTTTITNSIIDLSEIDNPYPLDYLSTVHRAWLNMSNCIIILRDTDPSYLMNNWSSSAERSGGIKMTNNKFVKKSNAKAYLETFKN